jgi:predicted aspartyl protease
MLLLLSCAGIAQQPTSDPSVHLPASGQRTASGSNYDSLIQERDYPELERKLPLAHLSESDRDYFEGVLANRKNQLQKSIALLEKVVPQLRQNQPARAAVALRTLAGNYVKTFRYADADHAFSDLLKNFAKQYDKAERQSLEDDAQTNRLLVNAPAQTVDFSGSTTIPTHHSKVGTIDADFTVAGVTTSWVLDTGANLSVVSESLARKMHLELSKGQARTQGITGAENPLHVALIPEMKVGSATVRNAVVMVLPDSSLNVKFQGGSYQIDAILGYPVLSALGQLTFTKDEHLVIDSKSEDRGAVMYMQELTPLLQAQVDGRDLLFSFDTGAQSTVFTIKYYNAFSKDFRTMSKNKHGISGAGGVKMVDSFTYPIVKLQVGDQTVTLKNIPVFAEALRTDLDLLFGNIGRDLTDNFQSFTLDFKAMRFRLSK